jgi:hypothetical protein
MSNSRRDTAVDVGDLRYNSLSGKIFLVVDFKSRDLYSELLVLAFVPANSSFVIYDHWDVKNHLLIARLSSEEPNGKPTVHN